jgi:hypothetical protein
VVVAFALPILVVEEALKFAGRQVARRKERMRSAAAAAAVMPRIPRMEGQ